MHMADALLSPAVAGAMGLVSAAVLTWATRRLARCPDERRVPLMGALGAFVFALQLLNFAIPGTGASGHLCGGLLLAILLGTPAALVVLASVLMVQAVFFADGGLMALGANFFNMAVLPCAVVYPLLYRPLTGPRASPHRQRVAVCLSALAALQLGAAAVVLQTEASGVIALPWRLFAGFMMPVHALIGVAEGLATAALLQFLQRSAPELLAGVQPHAESPARPAPWRAILSGALLGAGVLSWFASPLPDGLEWSWAQTVASAAPQLPQAWPEIDAAASLRHIAGTAAAGLIVLALAAAVQLRRRSAGHARPAEASEP